MLDCHLLKMNFNHLSQAHQILILGTVLLCKITFSCVMKALINCEVNFMKNEFYEKVNFMILHF